MISHLECIFLFGEALLPRLPLSVFFLFHFKILIKIPFLILHYDYIAFNHILDQNQTYYLSKARIGGLLCKKDFT